MHKPVQRASATVQRL